MSTTSPVPFRVAALAKQIPLGEEMVLDTDGRLRREGVDLEMNAYCRRAVSKGTELAQATGGSCTVFTMGPPSAGDVLREAVAWGADRGVHLCDPAFAGSDTLATARALAAALRREGPFDLVLVGRNSLDGDTGQVGPELAQLLDLPFATGVRELTIDGTKARLRLELDDGWEEATLTLPAVLSVAERLTEPCKVPPEGRAAVSPGRLSVLSADDLGDGPWGQAGSPTRVGQVRTLHHERQPIVLSGPVAGQVAAAIELVDARGGLTSGARPESGGEELAELAAWSLASGDAPDSFRPIAVVVEADRPMVARELTAGALRLAAEAGGRVVVLAPEGHGEHVEQAGADELIELLGEPIAEDVAAELVAWAEAEHPWVVLAPSTAFGREVAARAAAQLGAGLVGDAVGLDMVDGILVAAKPAFSGALVADITCTSEVQLVTVRPGVLPAPPRRSPDRARAFVRSGRPLRPRGRLTVLSRQRDDDVEVLARAEVVIGVGAAVAPDEYPLLSPLAALLGAELAATRKVTDKGWAPRARQLGITGRSIAPRLYVAIGVGGKFNHMAGVRGAGTILAINHDPSAPVFSFADVGIVADWHEVLPEMEAALRARTGAQVPVGGEQGATGAARPPNRPTAISPA